MNRKICQRNPSKKKQKSSSQYFRDWRFLYQAWWIFFKFKHGKIEANWTCSCTISLVHLDTQDFFSFTMNVFHFPFSFLVYLLMFFFPCIIFIFTVNKICTNFPKFHFFSLKSEKQVLTTQKFHLLKKSLKERKIQQKVCFRKPAQKRKRHHNRKGL